MAKAARKIRLSPRKQAWAGKFKPKQLRGAVLRPSAGVAARYNRSLQALIDLMLRETQREVEKLFTSPVAIESHVTTDASISSQSRILMNGLISRFTVLFAQQAKPISERMVKQSEKNSSTDLKSSLKEISGNVTLKTDTLKSGPVADIAKASVNESVTLIKSIPQRFLDKTAQAVSRSITSGNGLQDLKPFFEKQKGITKRHAELMAEDQTRKVYNGINRGRMEALGFTSFEWIHTGGSQQPRQDHIDMSGNVYRFDNLPVIDERSGERGIPGQAPNCRCVMRPILSFER